MIREPMSTDARKLRKVRLEEKTPHVSVVIPARNEAENLKYVLPRIPSDVFEVILVDGHSTDDTIAAAREILPSIRIAPQEGQGKGDALRTGFDACTGDIIVMLDADGSTDPQEIPRFVSALMQGADFVKGSRYLAGGGSADFTPHRNMGNAGLTRMVNGLFSTRYTDLCYGYNAFWRDCLEYFDVDCDGFEVETLLNIRAHQSALVVAEVPSYEYQRIAGSSNLHVVRDGLRVLRTVLTEWWKGHTPAAPDGAEPVSRLDRLEAMPTLQLPAISAATLSSALEPAREPEDQDARARSLPAIAPGTATVAVIIAAYAEDRWLRLHDVIESLQRQTRRPDEIILVIDHNPSLVAVARATLSGVRVVENTHARGLSGARNTGIELAGAEFVAFVDDDATPEPDWLETLLLACVEQGAVGAGGALLPEWQGERPGWFPDEFGWVIGCSYAGLPSQQAKVRNLIGASMLIRRRAFAIAGGFREDMGRIGRHPVGCEETDWCLRAQRMLPGGYFLYAPDARSLHFVPESRAQLSYFIRRCYHEGMSKAQVVAHSGAGVGLSAERAQAMRVLPHGVWRGMCDLILRGDINGAARAAMVGAGLGFTVAGFVAGRVSLAIDAMKGAISGRQQPVGIPHAASLAEYLTPVSHTSQEERSA